MKNLLLFFSLLLVLFLFPGCKSDPDLSSPWQHPLYMGNSGFWKQRVPIVVQNNTDFYLRGDPISLIVGKGKKKLPLKGVMAESVRITNHKGDQLLYRIDDRDGKMIQKGPIPGGAKVTIPLECKPGEKSNCFIYFDNTSAWPVGEYLYTHREIRNGGFEKEDEFGPLGWELKWPQDSSKANWVKSETHSGENCLELISDRREMHNYIGASQGDIHLIPGVKYEVTARFKSEGLDGEAGLILQAANLGRTKRGLDLKSVRLEAKPEMGEWEQASIEFIAPEESNILTIHAFMNGQGKLRIDDIDLACKAAYNLLFEIKPVEKIPIKERGKTDQWLAGDWPIRASVTVPNFTNVNLKDHPVYVDIQELMQRLYKEVDGNTLWQLTYGFDSVPYVTMENAILFKQDIPAFTSQTFYLYFSDIAKQGSIPKPDSYTDLSQITNNLIENPGFEDRDIGGWERFGEDDSKRISLLKEDSNPVVQLSYTETGEETKTKVSDIEVSHTTTDAEIGLYQVFDIKPGSSYLISARVKSSNILDRTYTLRAHFIDENGKLVGDKETQRANPDMHQNFEWVKESMLIRAPKESKSLKLELLNTVKGKVWYDDVYLIEVGSGYTGAMTVERKAERDIDDLRVWEKNPVEKVFPDDLPDKKLEKLSISAARNDVEPVQILFRSRNEYKDLEIKLNPLEDNKGNKLGNIEIGIVGYVPINYTSNYHRDFETPFWRTKIPNGKIGSDGWAGWWPDPILPFQQFDLSANMTKAAWIEVSVPEDAVTGYYAGNIQLIQRGEVLKEFPLSMQVYNFTLPEETSVKATYVPRFNERKMFGNQYTEQEYTEKIWRYMAKHKVSPETILPQPKYSLKNGEVNLDFTEFDKAAIVYFEEMKFTSAWSPRDLFYLFGWGHPPRDKFGENPYPGEPPYHDADRSQLRPEFKRKYQSALRQYWNHMKEKGWADKVVIYISDEPHDDPEMIQQMKAVCNMIHEVDPEIPIYVSTWWYRPEFEGYVDVWGVSHRGGGWGHPVPPEHLERAVNNGGKVYFTTDGMQCTDTPYLGFERMLPHFCFKYGASEYEFWAANWHTLNPFAYGWHRFHRQSPSAEVWYWMRYPNGDGNFIYPGQPLGVDHLVPSIRLKQAREGVEDFEFMNTLELLIRKCRSKGIDTEQAQKALNRALELVTIPCADGRYTTDYTPDPDLLMEIRHDVAVAIEGLSER